ncbi:MAG: efflux RND transporter periplasmic adaptor subunit [Desulfovibrionaceae bacterium]|jgi:macrolide-specific efflux system membrane fusion protein|nr:efflux RND transporter periplasmic adaptor subunit [Desulfovibrionaceae bacterium]
MNRFWKLTIILALVALGIGAKMRFFPAPQAVSYVTAPAVTADVRESVLATGTLKAFQQVSVGAQVSGQIKSLKVELGDAVRKGDLIAEIDSQSQRNALRTAEAQLNNVKAQRAAKMATLKQAQSEFERQEGMLRAKATSRQNYEDALATLTETQADIAALDAQIVSASITVDTARIDLGYTSIVAPMDGVVVAVVAKEGQTVNAAQSTPTIVKLAQLDTMTVKAEVSEADVVHVQPGQRATFTILGEPDHEYVATLRSIEPAPDSITEDDDATTSSSSDAVAVYYNALLDVPNPDHKLRISMTAEVSIVLAEAKGALAIPATALDAAGAGGNATVRVLGDDGRPQARTVRTGLSDGVHVQILDGLAPGERVILGEADADAATQQATRRRRPMGL